MNTRTTSEALRNGLRRNRRCLKTLVNVNLDFLIGKLEHNSLMQNYEKLLKNSSVQKNCSHLDKLLLLRYLKVNDFNQEAAQKLLYTNLKLRKKHSDVFTDRDIQSTEIETAISAV